MEDQGDLLQNLNNSFMRHCSQTVFLQMLWWDKLWNVLHGGNEGCCSSKVFLRSFYSL